MIESTYVTYLQRSRPAGIGSIEKEGSNGKNLHHCYIRIIVMISESAFVFESLLALGISEEKRVILTNSEDDTLKLELTGLISGDFGKTYIYFIVKTSVFVFESLLALGISEERSEILTSLDRFFRWSLQSFFGGNLIKESLNLSSV